MNIFALTKLKVATVFVVVTVFISLLFSTLIYTVVVNNLKLSFNNAEMRFNARMRNHRVQKLDQLVSVSDVHAMFSQELKRSQQSVLFYLSIINLFILVLSISISYYLADKILAPIDQVIQEQKRFIADASHELKTPLTSLKTSIEVAIRDKKLPSEVKKLLQYNVEDIDSLNQLVNKLLELSSLETKQPTMKLVRVDRVIQSAVGKVKSLARNKKIKVITKLNRQSIRGDKDLLVELFVIILDNAIKFSDSKSKVVVTTKVTKKHLVIFVKDFGVGIEPKYLTHIFDRFYQVNSARTKELNSGFGLGLSVAKEIVEVHHGKLSVQSRLGKGTVLSVKLPL